MKHLFGLLIFIINSTILFSASIHVSKTGNDSNNGTEASPYLTISKAAEQAQPGDTIIIHAGTYREYINPPRGGTDDTHRIIYKAVNGDTVYVKGSEVINTWTNISGDVWEATIPNSFFNGYNPYNLNVDDTYQEYGQWHHRGDVYIKNGVLNEVQNIGDVNTNSFSWFATVTADNTIIRANFDTYNPNTELTEINVRELIFFPTQNHINYITIDGIKFLHAAPNWQMPHTPTMVGAIGSKQGKGWIIENCEVSYSKTAGIMIGITNELINEWEDITAYGEHVIKNNIITKCGEYGIAGATALSRSLIEGNLIEDINYRNEFGGFETSGIKVWTIVDATIKNNIIRRVTATLPYGGFGLWLDYGNQGCRVTGNIIYSTASFAIALEANFGPNLLDNNIIIGSSNLNLGLWSRSAGTILAHNLFYNCYFDYNIQIYDPNIAGTVRDFNPATDNPANARGTYIYMPHTRSITPAITHYVNSNLYGTPERNEFNKTYNNIFIGPPATKTIQLDSTKGDISSHNAYMGGAVNRPLDKFSQTSSTPVPFTVENMDNGVNITFTIDNTPLNINAPFVNTSLIGTYTVVGQSIEDKNGNPITVNTDLNGLSRNQINPTVGPIENLILGSNLVSWSSNLFPTPIGIVYPPPPINTGIIEAKQDDFKIYPNPANEKVNFIFDNINNEEFTLIISDLIGLTVYSIKTMDNIIEANIKDLPEGVYIYRLISKTNEFGGKFIKF